MKTILQHPDAPSCVREANKILRQCCGAEGSGTPLGDMDIFNTLEDRPAWRVHGVGKDVVAGGEVKGALSLISIEVQDKATIKMFLRFSLGKHTYATRAVTQTNSNIFWEELTGNLVPGVIEHIFTTAEDEQGYFIAMQNNLPIAQEETDPFTAYKDFGASLWRDEYAQELHVFPLKESTYCHAILMPWEVGKLVMKPLNRIV
ncbi:hypothetical protein OG21DRAFT_1489430 [Imleria badia]|nr:hypothetical protein OG21DRAFT_1489430 [Imleria badia]